MNKRNSKLYHEITDIVKRALTLLILLLSLQIQAQSDDIAKSREAYSNGHFATVDSMLQGRLRHLRGQDRVEAYRLLSLSAFYTDRMELAHQWIGELLSEDPYYTAYGENPRYQDIVESFKHSGTTITTASQQSESLEESPVPVTVITEEMIQLSGARTVRELLTLYVPGMNPIECMDANLAMRGLYGFSQEQILVMVDGHRMNSGMTNGESMEYHISMDKIKQVEVLRGPASSLYGNVALSAVVNIITKKGQEVDGLQASLSVGNHGTYGAGLLFGGGTMKTDVLLWGNLYYAKGQTVSDADGVSRINGGYNRMPSFDAGVKVKWHDLSFTLSADHIKRVPFYNMVSTSGPTTFAQYEDRNGNGPGKSNTNIRANIDYSHSWGRFALTASAFLTYERSQIYNVMADEMSYESAVQFLKSMEMYTPDMEVHTRGIWQNIQWSNYTVGGRLTASYAYECGSQKGNLLGGVQYESFVPIANQFDLGAEYSYVWSTTNYALEGGHEPTASAFVQLKHYFLPQLIFNGGLRFDYRSRFDSSESERKNHYFSPRASLIYLASDRLSARFSYAHSYVDAPYFYRACIIPLISGGRRLKAQTLDAMQLGATYERKDLGLKLEANLFYNMSRDLVVYSPLNLVKTYGTEWRSPYYNAGRVNIGGLELIGQWRRAKGTYITANITAQYGFRLEDYGVSDSHNIANIPNFHMNLLAGQKLYGSQSAGAFWLRGNLHVQSSTHLIQNDYRIIMALHEAPTLYSSPQAMLNLGADWHSPRYSWGSVKLSADLYNATNARFRYGTLLQSWQPAQGIHIVGKATFNF